MTEIRCTVPLRVRISGDPQAVPAAELEARLARTIARRIAAARQAVSRRHRGKRSESASAPMFRFPEGMTQEARDRVRGAVERAVARALAGERDAAPGIVLASFRGGTATPAARARRVEQRPWLILRSLDFHARVGDFFDLIIDLHPELAPGRTLYLEHLDETRWIELWFVRVNRRYLLSEIVPILRQRAMELGHVRSNQTLAIVAAPYESLRRRLAAIDRDHIVGAEIPDLTRNAARYRDQGDDVVLEAGALLLFAWMIVPKVELATYVESGTTARLDLPLEDLTGVLDAAAFETYFHVPLTTFVDEVPDARGTLVLAPFTVRRQVLTPTLDLLYANAIEATESASAFRSGNVELLTDAAVSQLPAAAQSAASAATDTMTRALPDGAADDSWQPGWRGAAIYALFEPTLEQKQAAFYRPFARNAADAAIAWLRRDWSEFITRLSFSIWLKTTFAESAPLPFEYFLTELEGRENGRWFARLFDVPREYQYGELIQALLVRALATRYANDPRVQALYRFFNAAHVAALRHAYSVENQAMQLDRAGPWIGVNDVLGQVKPLYTLDKKQKVLHADKKDAFAAAARDAAKDLLGRIFRGEDTKEYDEQTFLAAVLGAAAEKIGLTENDFDDQVVRRSIRLLGIERRVINAIDHYWIRYDLVESIDGGEWKPVEGSEKATTDSEFEQEIWWWVYHKTAKVIEIFAIGVSVVAVAAVALEVGAVALLIEAAGGAKAVLISVTLSELIYIARVVFGDAHLSWEEFFIAALDGYLIALTFRGAGIIGKGLARAIGKTTLERLLLGWFVQKMTVGLIGGGASGAVLTFTHGIFNVLLHGGGAPGLKTYARNIGYGMLFGMGVEFTVAAAAPIFRVAGENALLTAKELAVKLRATGITAEQLAVISAQTVTAIRNQLAEALEEVAVRGIVEVFQEKLAELLRWYAGEVRLALFKRLIELAPEALSAKAGERVALSGRAAVGVERIVAASGRFLADQALLDILNSIPAGQLRSFFEAASILRRDALEQIVRSGQLARLAADPQLIGYLSRDITISALIAEEAAHGAGIATFRVQRLIDLAARRTSLPAEISRGGVAFRGADGRPVAYDVEGFPELVVKPGGAQVAREAAALVELELLGLKTVYATTLAGEGEAQVLLERVEGVGSKNIIGSAKNRLRPPQNTEIVTQRTIDDLHKIQAILAKNRVRPDDFQFVVRRSDGAVIINDPKGLVFNAPSMTRGQFAYVIREFEKIWRDRQSGGTP